MASESAQTALEPVCIAGRPVRERELYVSGEPVRFFEAADVDALLEDAIERGERPPYGAVPWASAAAVAQRLAETWSAAGAACDVTVLDVGCGTGIGALAAARLGARALALDVDPFALALVEAAARAQGLAVELYAFDLEGDEPLPKGELVLFSDVLYEGPLADAAARRVLEVLERGDEVLVADPGRAGRERFLARLDEAGVHGGFTPVAARLPGDARTTEIGVFRARGAR